MTSCGLVHAHIFRVGNMALLHRQEERYITVIQHRSTHDFFIRTCKILFRIEMIQGWQLQISISSVKWRYGFTTEVLKVVSRLSLAPHMLMNSYVSWIMFHIFSCTSRRLAQWVCATASTDWNKQCGSNPTMPTQPDTTGSLPSHVNLTKSFHYFKEALGRVERGSWCFHHTIARLLDTSKRFPKADSFRKVTEFDKYDKFTLFGRSQCLW